MRKTNFQNPVLRGLREIAFLGFWYKKLKNLLKWFKVNNALSERSLQLAIVTKLLLKVKKIYNSVNQAKCAQSRHCAQIARNLRQINRNTFIS